MGKLNKPAQAEDGRTVLTLSPEALKAGEANWLATVTGRGYFVILRLYIPQEATMDGNWKPGDIEKVE